MRRPTSDTYTLRDGFKDFVLDKEELKKELEEYITAPHFSLDLRWQMFLDAPMDLSNHEDFIYDGLNFVKTGPSTYDTWMRHQEYQRGQVIELTDVIYNFESILKGLKENNPYTVKNYKDKPAFKDPDLVIKAKEQLLKDNIKSFTYDW